MIFMLDMRWWDGMVVRSSLTTAMDTGAVPLTLTLSLSPRERRDFGGRERREEHAFLRNELDWF